MNKLFTKIAVPIIGMAMAIGVGIAVGRGEVRQAKAEDEVYKSAVFTGTSFSANSNSYTGSFSSTTDGFTVNITNANNNNKAWDYIKIGGKNGAYTGTIITDAKIDEPVTKVELGISAITAANVTSITLYSSSNGSSWSSVGTFDKSIGTKAVAPSSPTANLYYKIEAVCTKGSSNGLLTLTHVDFYKTSSSGGPTTYTVSYDSNGGGSETLIDENSPYNSGATVTVLANSFSAPSYNEKFSKWNTAANGSGTNYNPGATFSISANTTLYAQWTYKTLNSLRAADDTPDNTSYEADDDFNPAGLTIYATLDSVEDTEHNIASLISWGSLSQGVSTVEGTYTIGEVSKTITISGLTVTASTKVTDTLTYSLIGRTGTSYGGWTGKTSVSDAVYAGNTAGGNSAIQLRSSDNSGIVSTTSGGNLKKVIVTFNSNTTATRTISVYGKAATYASSSDLYANNTQGTLIQEVNVDNGATQTINVSDSYQYIGIRSKSGAIYLDEIKVVWQPAEVIATYNVTYDLNGGTGAEAPEGENGLLDGGNHTVASFPSGLARDGYTLGESWNTSADGNGDSYEPGDTLTIDGASVTLYAQWSEVISNDRYQLVKDESELISGDHYIIGNSDGDYFLSTTQASNNRTAVAATVENEVVADKTTIEVIVLEGNSSQWSLKTTKTTGYLYTATTGSNRLHTRASDSDNNSKWTISITNEGVATINNVGNTDRGAMSYNSNNNSPIFACYASSSENLSIYKLIGEDKTVSNSKMTVGTVSASSGDLEWTLNGFSFEVLYDGDSEYTDVTSETTFVVTEDVPTIEEDGTTSVTVTPEFKGVSYTAKAAEVTATLTFVNIHTIAQLYANDATNKQYEVDGIYMGEVADGYIFMNGEYGILVFDSSHTKTLEIGGAYSLSGTRAVYSGLVELKNVTEAALENGSRKNRILTPVTYNVVGGETADTANRKTSLTGIVKTMDSETTNTNSTVTIAVGGDDDNIVTVYVKAARATEKNMNALKGSKNSSSLITLEGYTSWYNGFQVSLTDVVVADDTYTIYDFARSLLKLTRTTCTGGSFDNTTNKSTLVSIWGTLSGANYYGQLTAAKKSDLANSSANGAIVVPNTDALIDEMSDADALAAAMYRYDYCTAKYNLTNFIEGRTLTVSFSNVSFLENGSVVSNAPVIITVIFVLSLTVLGAFFFIKKRKEQ